MNEVIRTIEEGKDNENIPFAVFKITGICRFALLEKANLGREKLDETDKKDFEILVARLRKICAAAHLRNVPIFIDAEESWIQDTIDALTYDMSKEFNAEKAIVYNTIQLYRHDRYAFLKSEIERAKQEGFFLGVKLVRGAYMEKERKRALDQNYPSPIQ